MTRRITLNQTSYFGRGAIQEIIPELKNRSVQRVMINTDEGVLALGLIDKIASLLQEAGLEYQIFSKINPNPSIEDVQAGLKALKEFDAQAIIAVGGGSPIDASKAIAIIATNPEFSDVRSLEGLAQTKNPCLPLIAVSTTSGTAAEVTINYVITDIERQRKFVCADPHDIPVVAIVDPDMSQGMPASLCAATGMDALVHAIEGYITKGAWAMTDMFHLEAIRMIAKNLPAAVKGDPEAREAMSLAQYIAGMGFSNVGLGIVHSMAHPLSALYGIAHGKACAMMLCAVLEYNAPATGEKYKEIARAFGIEGLDEMSQDEYRAAAIEAVRALAQEVGIPERLSELGVQEKDLDFLAKSAFNDACTPGNPAEVTQEQIEQIYRKIL